MAPFQQARYDICQVEQISDICQVEQIHQLYTVMNLRLHAAHPLPEIRYRSLQNLVFKINHGLAKQAAEVTDKLLIKADIHRQTSHGNT